MFEDSKRICGNLGKGFGGFKEINGLGRILGPGRQKNPEKLQKNTLKPLKSLTLLLKLRGAEGPASRKRCPKAVGKPTTGPKISVFPRKFRDDRDGVAARQGFRRASQRAPAAT